LDLLKNGLHFLPMKMGAYKMMIGTIDLIEAEQAAYHPAIAEALHYLAEHDFTKMEDGKYPIGEHGIVANLQRYQTRPEKDCKPESHQEFVDIQYVVEGEEYLGWCPLSPDLIVTEDYDAERDVMFYQSLIPDSSVMLFPGSYAVLYPVDVHRPCIALEDGPGPVTKVVVKIPVDILL